MVTHTQLRGDLNILIRLPLLRGLFLDRGPLGPTQNQKREDRRRGRKILGKEEKLAP